MVFAVAAASIGSLIPDIDHPHSMLASSSLATRKISKTVSSVTQHRGFTHTLIFGFLLWALFIPLMKYLGKFGVIIQQSFSLGFLSHLALDTMNEKGVMWLWPFLSKHFHILRVRTGSTVEIAIRVILNISVTFGVVVLVVNYLKTTPMSHNALLVHLFNA